MAVKRDYYEVLSVTRDANEDEIRRAFRRLARQYHPDVNKDADADARFKEVNEAYDVLTNAEKRQQYDRFGHGSPAGVGASGFGIEDIFETFFGGGGRSGRRPARGADLRYDLTISFEEAMFGTSKKLEIPRTVPCGRCSGNRSEPGSQPERCPRCNGAGEIRHTQQSVFGQFVNVTMCDRCRGAGSIVTKPCTECRGIGEVRHVRELTLNVPAGVDEGQQLHLVGEGELGARGGPPGDLYVVLTVEPHETFKRRGDDLILEQTINVAQAALGTDLEVPTFEGTERVRIPAGTQSGRIVRVRGRGVPRLRTNTRGDLQVHFRVEIPTKITDDQRRLFQQLAATFDGGETPGAETGDGRAHSKGIFGRVKDALGAD